jgi:hypothetical protein
MARMAAANEDRRAGTNMKTLRWSQTGAQPNPMESDDGDGKRQ